MTTARLQRVLPGLLADWLPDGVRRRIQRGIGGLACGEKKKGEVFERRLLFYVSGRNRTLLLFRIASSA